MNLNEYAVYIFFDFSPVIFFAFNDHFTDTLIKMTRFKAKSHLLYFVNGLPRH